MFIEQNYIKALELMLRLKKEMPYVYEQITFGVKPLIPSYALEDAENPYWKTQEAELAIEAMLEALPPVLPTLVWV